MNMPDRTGEKIGWTAGWMGGFIWVVILSIIFIIQNKTLQGFMGIIIVCIAFAVIILFAPWRHPLTPFWKLMTAPYVIFLVSAAWAIWSYGATIENMDLNWWNVFLIAPIFIPFATAGKRKWADGDPGQKEDT